MRSIVLTYVATIAATWDSIVATCGHIWMSKSEFLRAFCNVATIVATMETCGEQFPFRIQQHLGRTAGVVSEQDETTIERTITMNV